MDDDYLKKFQEICRAGEAADQLLFEEKHDEAIAAYLAAAALVRSSGKQEQYLISKLCLGLIFAYLRSDQKSKAFEIASAQLEDFSPEAPWGLGMMGLDQWRVSDRDYACYNFISAFLSYACTPDAAEKTAELRYSFSRACEISLERDLPDVFDSAINAWKLLLYQMNPDDFDADSKELIVGLEKRFGRSVEIGNITMPKLDQWEIASEQVITFKPDGSVEQGKRDPHTLLEKKPWWKFW